jgi:hypothetical protein
MVSIRIANHHLEDDNVSMGSDLSGMASTIADSDAGTDLNVAVYDTSEDYALSNGFTMMLGEAVGEPNATVP